MDSNGDMRRRPDLWSYISFSRPHSRNGVTNNIRLDEDPYEKAARRGRSHASSLSLSESQIPRLPQQSRSRLWKICGAVFAFIVILSVLGGGPSGRISRTFRSGGKGMDHATGKCTESYLKDRPLIQHALMIDAGSTGSRIHVYRFNNCGPTPELEDEIFEQTQKKEGKGSGLSSYDSDADGAAKSLDVLMKVAMDTVPENDRSCTPIAVKATAGLRKLGEEKSNRILRAVRTRLEQQYPFPVLAEDRGGVEVMDGTDEGVYAWITAYYLQDKIRGPAKNPTAAVFDLGGGSTQIVFEPTFPNDPHGGQPEKMAEGEHKYELSFGGRNFSLYQHSYLGYGLMAAREGLHKVVFDTAYENNSRDRSWLSKPVINPCINTGFSQEVTIPLDAGHTLGKEVTVNMTGPKTNSAAQCRALAEKTLLKDADCKLKPCAFNGVYQPSFTQTFAREDVYLFSYFYDRTKPLGMPETFTLKDLRDLASKVCGGESEWGVFSSIDGALDELRDRAQYCLDLNFMVALLNTGYEMPMEREVKIAKKIKSRELGWCLGASLPLLSQESGWQCKVKQVI